MSGRLKLLKNNKINNDKHDHFKLFTNKEYSPVFNDPRKFGFIDFDKANLIMNKNYILKLVEYALSKNLSSKYLKKKISKSIVPIKQILLDQTIIAGIGNIYASEILFDAKISPFCKGKNLSIQNCNRIIKSTKKILNKAIQARGSTLRNFLSADGTAGNSIGIY